MKNVAGNAYLGEKKNGLVAFGVQIVLSVDV